MSLIIIDCPYNFSLKGALDVIKPKEDIMKPFIYGSVLVLVTFLSLPTTSDAFSRRSSGSEFSPMHATTSPANSNTSDVSAQSVPEPPVLFLMSIGLGVFALAAGIKAFRKQS